ESGWLPAAVADPVPGAPAALDGAAAAPCGAPPPAEFSKASISAGSSRSSLSLATGISLELLFDDPDVGDDQLVHVTLPQHPVDFIPDRPLDGIQIGVVELLEIRTAHDLVDRLV